MAAKNELVTRPMDGGFIFNPQTYEDALKYCETISKSELVPKDFQGKPGNVMVAIQMGQEIGLKPLQALQNIAVINGRPALWGDAVVAIVRGSGTLEYLNEEWDEKTQTATCTGKRKSESIEIKRTFSMADAKLAGLLERGTVWKSYPRRMAQCRARAWVLRDGWADYLKGISIREEVEDVPVEPLRKVEAVPTDFPEAPPIETVTPTPTTNATDPVQKVTGELTEVVVVVKRVTEKAKVDNGETVRWWQLACETVKGAAPMFFYTRQKEHMDVFAEALTQGKVVEASYVTTPSGNRIQACKAGF